MIKSYQRLFQLDAFHSYFQKDVCRCLEFNAEAATEHLMKRFRLLIRRQVNGIGLYSNSTQSPAQFLAYIEQATGQDAFCFEIRTNNPDFNFFTELPADWVGQLLYDSSNSSAQDNHVQLNQQLSGNAGTLCMGKVRLRFEDILKFSEQTGYAPFNIRYAARATQWQYFVINRSSVPLSAPAISGKTSIHFEGPENVFTAAGQAALLFSSGSSLIPMNEAPIHKFDLVNFPEAGVSADSKSLRPQMIVKGLPTPNPQWIGRVAGDRNGQLSSPMYVYL